jgi:carbamoyl-phosphate synthase large subunit
MKSVGETMAIGRTFKEALQKAVRSLEIGRHGLGADGRDPGDARAAAGDPPTRVEIESALATPNSQRLFALRQALRAGMSVAEIQRLTGIDPWFLHQIDALAALERELSAAGAQPPEALLARAKAWGFSDIQLAWLGGGGEDQVRARRQALGLQPAYLLVDTCAAEFRATTPYYYSSYESQSEVRVSQRPKVMILGGGPNRIGQGIEFDYCCVHASYALRQEGVESIMVNSNPETVSTDYDTSDKLYFEPLTKEDVLNIVDVEKPMGVIVQFGGQTPLNLAGALAAAGVPILGTQPSSIDRAEDRQLFQALLHRLGLVQPANATALNVAEALAAADKIGYPVIVRPSYVLGGRAMKIVHRRQELENFTRLAITASPDHPVLIDQFLEDAVEVDVDAICDGERTVIGGIMEHIEAAGVHSGDSACVLPPHSLGPAILEEIAAATRAMARELEVRGLMNVQYAVKGSRLYVLEVNPRASRTVPFVSKATGVPLAGLATRVMLGRSLAELGFTREVVPRHVAVKEAVLPFDRFPDVDTLLGPEMKSTGEVMGIDPEIGPALAKAQLGAGQRLPVAGTAFISVKDGDKEAVGAVAGLFARIGFRIVATRGTARHLAAVGLAVTPINKVSMGRPHVVDAIKNRDIQVVINTGGGGESTRDGYEIRRAAIKYGIPYATTIAGAMAMGRGIAALARAPLAVKTLQEYNSPT